MLRCLLLILALSSALQAQQNTGALKGTVTDPMGSLVAGARVTIKNTRGVIERHIKLVRYLRVPSSRAWHLPASDYRAGLQCL